MYVSFRGCQYWKQEGWAIGEPVTRRGNGNTGATANGAGRPLTGERARQALPNELATLESGVCSMTVRKSVTFLRRRSRE